MKKAFVLALMAATLAAGPALAREQSSEYQQQGQQSQRQSLDRDTARQVQQQLKQQGYDPGAVDGVWGQRSRQALMNFQRDQNMQASGQPDQQTLAALGVERGSTQQAQTPEQSRRQRGQGFEER